jgi:hypothetical protein
LKLKDLVLQLIFGFKYQVVFYYQFNLILLSIIFTFISILFNEKIIIIFQTLLIVSYFLQYSIWNKYIFKKYSLVIRIPLGSFLELLPFAVSGITLHYLEVITKLKKNRKLSIFFIESIIFLILKYDVFVKIKGYFFPGIFLNIGGICLFILFSVFSFRNKKLVVLLKIISKFTGGGSYSCHYNELNYLRFNNEIRQQPYYLVAFLKAVFLKIWFVAKSDCCQL